ncbi:MAG: lipopolysaccharide transport periplasmic protein LptA [Proteobacteria bacterium]|nr:lipopolysaccharide transport periplasmic protein LptA [Pseudomonadota bacterium]
MTACVQRRLTRNLAGFALLLPLLASAQLTDLDGRLPWDIDAESTSYDGKTSTLVFTGLRLSRGSIAIEADAGRVTNKDMEDSSWHFSGNVIIDIENGHIECESAELKFADYELRLAIVTGSPASFRLTRHGNKEATVAEAGRLSYDVEAGIIEFSGDATITEGGNRFSSNFLVYNIVEQRINAHSSGSEDGRVRIIYTPTNGEDMGNEDENP